MKKVELLEYNEENASEKHYRLSNMTEAWGDDDYNEVSGWYEEYKKEKQLYPDTRPKKKSRRSSGGAQPSPRGGDSSSDSD